MRARSAAVLALVGLTGCYVAHRRAPPSEGREVDAEGETPPPRDAGPDAGRDASRASADARPRPTPRDAGPPRPMPCEDPQGVDFLLVLDDSGSIRPRDAQLRDRMRRLFYGLLRPDDRDRDGWEDWPRVTDLHFGVVSTSVQGTGFCDGTPDGRLSHLPASDIEGCAAAYPPFLTYEDGAHDPDGFALDTTCVAFGPRYGCTVEQPLEAMAKALLPRDAPFAYVAGRPRGDTTNAGFLRDDSVLVVLFVGDEDDCSVLDADVFERPDAGADRDASLPVLGCRLARPGQLYPLERYEAALRWLRPAHPERVVLGMIVGIAADVVVTDPRVEIPGCFGAIDYPRRMVGLARELPAQSVLGSVCGLSEMTFVHALSERVARAACGG